MEARGDGGGGGGGGGVGGAGSSSRFISQIFWPQHCLSLGESEDRTTRSLVYGLGRYGVRPFDDAAAAVALVFRCRFVSCSVGADEVSRKAGGRLHRYSMLPAAKPMQLP